MGQFKAKWLLLGGLFTYIYGCNGTSTARLAATTTDSGRAAAEVEQIVVDVAQVTRTLQGNPVGINLDYLVDADTNRPGGRPLAQAMKDMGVRLIRYPGGEKADYHLWSTSPWDKPHPQVFGYYRNYAQNLLDFDGYMAMVRQAGGEPYIVVGYDNSRNTGLSKQQYLANAVEWVRYANVKKHYNVHYWEIGNENWHNGTGSGAELAAVVNEFATAMKAVDPSIKIGASGAAKASRDGSPFWQTFLQNGGGRNLDFLVATNYSCQHDGCRPYRNNENRHLSWLSDTTEAIANYAPTADKERLRIIVAEYNSIVWSDKWTNDNDMMHALTSFDMFGQLIQEPKLDAALFWTTRWLTGKVNVMFALDDHNNLTAQGQALQIWGAYMQEQLVSANTSGLSAVYALHSPLQNHTVVLIMNKEAGARKVALQINNLNGRITQAVHRCFAADSGSSWSPVMSDQEPVELMSGTGTLELPSYSITILDF